ncbi:unnamed protein product [Oppiella nova]|uniref:PDZ domain-containing protein n=1 Tax=Oppiella nova TaxID=334625 RepID=A0A7R9QT03_9ACAR|nr:unnamed protein product [Oppiella nova]CAG2173835.1 unnamed protein product [Oppiella nova]
MDLDSQQKESVCVKEVHKDSAADKDGRLRKGDLILAVNERSLRDISFRDAVQVLREAASPLRLLILRENAQKLFTTHQCSDLMGSDRKI